MFESGQRHRQAPCRWGAISRSAGHIILRALVGRLGEDVVGAVELDQIAEIHEGRVLAGARRLLHVVGNDGDAIVGRQFLDQFLDLGGRDRVERGSRLVEQQHGGLDRHGAGDAQALLLAAGKAEARLVDLFLDLVPERRLAQRRLDAAVHLGLGQLLVEADAEGDVLVDRHREGCRLLEHHADAGAQPVQVFVPVEDVVAVEQHLAGDALARVEIVDAVEDAQQGRLAATRRPDEGGDRLVAQLQIDALQRLVAIGVIEVHVLDIYLDRLVHRRPLLGGGCSGRAHLGSGIYHVHGALLTRLAVCRRRPASGQRC